MCAASRLLEAQGCEVAGQSDLLMIPNADKTHTQDSKDNGKENLPTRTTKREWREFRKNFNSVVKQDVEDMSDEATQVRLEDNGAVDNARARAILENIIGIQRFVARDMGRQNVLVVELTEIRYVNIVFPTEIIGIMGCEILRSFDEYYGTNIPTSDRLFVILVNINRPNRVIRVPSEVKV